jgi:hypothetical protein
MKRLASISLAFLAVNAASAQNVGIGTIYPNNGRVVLKSTGSTSGLIVGDSSSGLSFYDLNGSSIGFNNYYNAGRKLMSTGYASRFFFDEASGTITYSNASVTGTQGSSVSLTSRFSIDREGQVGIGTTAPVEGLHLKGGNIRLDNASNARGVTIHHTGGGNGTYGGEIRLYSHNADSTIIIRGNDATTSLPRAGEILFIDPFGGGVTLELDGDYQTTGRSRIIVDELEIKGGADFAEYFDVASAGDVVPEAGMLVSIDEAHAGKLVVSNRAADKKVAGVISGAGGVRPGLMMGQGGSVANGAHPVAITGRVYVKAQASKRAIAPGDLLTTSVVPGYAMRAGKRSRGAVIGKAMSGLAKGEKGEVLVLLGIQ